MKRPFGLLLLAMLASAIPVLAGGVRIAGPALSVEPAVHDLGQMAQGSVHHLKSLLRNDGTAPLVIRSVKSDCGCTTAELPDSLLLPGQAAPLEITFAARNFSGHVLKQVFVETNDPGMPRASIRISAYVRPWVRVDPGRLEFGNVPRGTTPELTAMVKSARADTLRILALEADPEIFSVRTEQEMAGDSLVHRLHFRVRPDARTGVFRTHAEVTTNHRQARDLRIALNGQVHGFFRTDPTSVSFGQLRAGATRTRELRLIGTGTGRRELLSATCTEPRIGLETQAVRDGHEYFVRLTLPADMPPGSVKARLVLETDDPLQPRIEVGVRGRVRAAGAAAAGEDDAEEEEEEE